MTSQVDIGAENGAGDAKDQARRLAAALDALDLVFERPDIAANLDDAVAALSRPVRDFVKAAKGA